MFKACSVFICMFVGHGQIRLRGKQIAKKRESPQTPPDPLNLQTVQNLFSVYMYLSRSWTNTFSNWKCFKTMKSPQTALDSLNLQTVQNLFSVYMSLCRNTPPTSVAALAPPQTLVYMLLGVFVADLAFPIFLFSVGWMLLFISQMCYSHSYGYAFLLLLYLIICLSARFIS